MTEEVKFIVSELNKLLKTDYNLITFDSLSVEKILQLLVDILHVIGTGPVVNVKESNPADTNNHILESLKKIQYRPKFIDQHDPKLFRQYLLQGDRKTIYPILDYIFRNMDKIQSMVYLANFLIPIQLPTEAIANPEISNLWDEYQVIMNEFKDIHKSFIESVKKRDQFRELRSDIVIIESEKENVKKRLEHTQSRIDKIPQQELLLETSHAVRLARDRQKELQTHLDDQQKSVKKSSMINERLKKDFNASQAATYGTAPQMLLNSLLEETQVSQFMVQQNFPKEIAERKNEIQILEDTINQPSISGQFLNDLQNQVEQVSGEVHKKMDKQIAERGNQSENTLPFRQQATTVARNKEIAAVNLDQSAQELRDIEMQLHQKQDQLQKSVGGVILRGDEFKHYVDTLKAKSAIYKHQRATLAVLKSESADLQQTLNKFNLHQDTNLNFNFQESNNAEDSTNPADTTEISIYGVTELARFVDGLTRAVVAAREKVKPLTQQVSTLQFSVMDLVEQRDVKKQIYTSLNATLNTELTQMKHSVSEKRDSVKELEMTWKKLQTEHNRIEMLLQKAKEDQMMGSANGGISLKDTLLAQIREQEAKALDLAERNEKLKSGKDGANQQVLWNNLNIILATKLKCNQEAKHLSYGGTLTVQKGTETFTLQ